MHSATTKARPPHSVLIVPAMSAAGLEVTVDISHSYIGDVGLALTAPSGTTLVLRDGGGGSADDIVGTYPTTLTPLSSVGALAGESITGDWTLTATDNYEEMTVSSTAGVSLALCSPPIERF